MGGIGTLGMVVITSGMVVITSGMVVNTSGGKMMAAPLEVDGMVAGGASGATGRVEVFWNGNAFANALLGFRMR